VIRISIERWLDGDAGKFNQKTNEEGRNERAQVESNLGWCGWR
jgi:hypothetical protein